MPEVDLKSSAQETKTARRKRRYLALQNFTLARIPVSVAFALMLLQTPLEGDYVLVPLFLLLLLELTDFVDGILARRFGLVSEWGAMLDPYADSVSRLVVYWALACGGLVLALVPLAMAVRDITVAYLRIILAKNGRSVSARLSGKIKAAFQCCGAILAVTGPWYWPLTGKWTVEAISWLVILVTLFSITQYAMGALSGARRGFKDRF